MYKMQYDLTEDMDKYVEYYHDNYIRKISRNGRVGKPLFAHELWNQFDNVMKSIPTTNNSVEAWNGAWNCSQPSNPSLWTTIDGFRWEDGLAGLKWVEDNQNGADPDDVMLGNSRRIAVKLKYERLKNPCSRFQTRILSRANIYNDASVVYFKHPSKKTYSAFLFSSSSGGLLLSTENGESSSFPPLVESTKNGILEEFLLRRAPLLLLKWSTPFFHQKRMVLLISSSCGESSSFPPFEENSPKEELRRNSF